ncbi:hypothetical protein [Frankia sp. Cj3]|uniref:hypothetical protein n=1 Tax=Frankia sp. Cj3 TaxID=2880976 RepID=UPI001EF60BEB|nr:hypothetical protein [Frankia sp. Cj3]
MARVHPRRGEVADLLDAGRRHPTRALEDRALAKLDKINARIRDLETSRTPVADVVGTGCDSLTNCTCLTALR